MLSGVPYLLWAQMQQLLAVLMAALHPHFIHRTRLPDGKAGEVLPAFRAPLNANPRGSLRADLALYDIILFVALGFSMEDACAFFQLYVGGQLTRRTLQNWIDRECICWPPSNYTLEHRRAFYHSYKDGLPPPLRRRAHAQQQRIDLMQRWLAGEATLAQAAAEEAKIQQVLVQQAE